MEALLGLDRTIFLLINKGLSSPYLDGIMKFLSLPWLYIIALLYLLIRLYLKDKRRAYMLLIATIITFGIADITASYVWKAYTCRPRPGFTYCLNPNLPTGAGGWYGFPSNHAANITTCFVFLSLAGLIRLYLAMTFPILTGISRIYLGKHYPLDVFAGILWGLLVAILMYEIYKMMQQRIDKPCRMEDAGEHP
jgi:membrane-associated phospholipid phosphatase